MGRTQDRGARTRFFNFSVAFSVAIAGLIAISLVSIGHDDASDAKGIGNSAPPGIGGFGPFAGSGVELLSHLPVASIGGGQANVLCNDIWGWTDPLTGKEYAICGLTNATSFVDISDPFNPAFLGRVMTHTGNAAWRDMKVFNNHCYIVSDGNSGHGIQVFDLTLLRNADPNNPTIFQETAHSQDVGNAHNIVINEDSGYAYVVGSNRASGGLRVYDLNNDPLALTVAGSFSADGYTHDAQVANYMGPDPDHQGKEIAFASNEDTLTIVDVTDKSNMTQLSRVNYAGSEYAHQGWLSFDHQFLFMNDELDEARNSHDTRTHIWDVRDLDNPIHMGFFDNPVGTIDHNCYTRGRLLFQGNYSSGMRVLRYSDANNPVLSEVGYYDTYPTDDNVSFNGVWSVFPYFDSKVVVISDRQNGLFVTRMLSQWVQFSDDTSTYLPGYAGDMDEKDMVMADVDNDGDQDLFCVRRGNSQNPGARRNLFFQNDNGVFKDRTRLLCSPFFAVPDTATDIQATDVNNDGFIDLVVSCANAEPRLLLNRKRSRNIDRKRSLWRGFQEAPSWLLTSFSTTPNFQSVAAGDVTGDGYVDLFFSDADNNLEDRLLVNDGNGNFSDETATRMTTSISSGFGTKCQIADMNMDGHLDIIKMSTGTPSYLRILKNDGSGVFSSRQNLTNDSGASFVLGNFDNDANDRPDIYVVSSGQDYVLRNDSTGGNGNISTTRVDVEQSWETTGFGGNAAVADVDGDGLLDVAISDTDPELPDCNGGIFAVLRGEGSGQMEDPNDAIEFDWNKPGVYDVIWADVDGDGNPDLIQATCEGIQIFIRD